ncbi:hypothetical protein R1flu_027240 [Riccia fluitans]|uniref:Uncharacterized protein n=1 Tax=Riccia fluitans TaxID=41844 RepID=A0ABD1XI87_9MARC
MNEWVDAVPSPVAGREVGNRIASDIPGNRKALLAQMLLDLNGKYSNRWGVIDSCIDPNKYSWKDIIGCNISGRLHCIAADIPGSR